MIPECMLQNIAHPQRKPAAGEKISRRKTYTPPVRGMADESSAQMLAPNQVSAPAATQTRSMPPKLGTARLTSDGCTKIDEPTIVPTTIAVACVTPIVRASFAVTPRIVSSGVRRVPDTSLTPKAELRRISADRRRLAGHLPVHRLNRRDRIGLGRALVRPVPLHAREAQRKTAGILRARLDLVERDLGDHLRPQVHRVVVAPDLELEEARGLPLEHLVGEPLERLAEHDEAAARLVARAEVQVAQPAVAAAAAPL